jgi:tetratricopeptide (TPR) repeat protein
VFSRLYGRGIELVRMSIKIRLAAAFGSIVLASALRGGGGARILVTVTGAGGAPMDGATVTVTSPNMSSFKVESRSDAKGRTTAVLMHSEWEYTLRAEKAGVATTVARIRLASGESRSLVVALGSAGAGPEAPASDDAEALFHKGMDLYAGGDYRSAGTLFARATQLKRDMSEAFFQLAMCEYNLKRYPQSRATFQRYLQLAPQGEHAAEAREMLKTIPAS